MCDVCVQACVWNCLRACDYGPVPLPATVPQLILHRSWARCLACAFHMVSKKKKKKDCTCVWAYGEDTVQPLVIKWKSSLGNATWYQSCECPHYACRMMCYNTVFTFICSRFNSPVLIPYLEYFFLHRFSVFHWKYSAYVLVKIFQPL